LYKHFLLMILTVLLVAYGQEVDQEQIKSIAEEDTEQEETAEQADHISRFNSDPDAKSH